jgi:16S rRNA (cytosine1402-N4)-methyltransferase
MLRPERGGRFVDCTLGLGGHAEAILLASPSALVIGIDTDAESLERATGRLENFGDRFIGIHANFKELAKVLHSLGIKTVEGIVADLGISSYQLAAPDRGFSFQQEAPLDARMDRSRGQTAADMVNTLEEAELADLIYAYGEERGARKIARMIIRERARQSIETTSQLANLVVRALNIKGRWRIHPATRTFQALRIAVNEEIEGLKEFISTAISCLAAEARFAVISFHSLEDRVVKTAFRLESGVCQCEYGSRDLLGGFGDLSPAASAYPDTDPDAASKAVERPSAAGANVVCHRCGAKKRVIVLTRKPIRSSSEEIQINPRSRSARLRVCERVP